MYRFIILGSIFVFQGAFLGGCATRGQLRQVEEAQRAALEAERAERVATEQQLRAELAELSALRADVDALRRDLESLRSDFGTQITMLEDRLKFAMPVHFGFNEVEIEESDHAVLDRFVQVVQGHYAGSYITVEGFADPTGSEAYNRRLSERRAESVRAYLVERGLSEAQLRAVGYGEARPVAPGAAGNEPGAELNRRVVFVLEGGGPSVIGTPTRPTGLEAR